LDGRKIAYLEIGKNKGKVFSEQLSLYTNITKVSLDKGESKEQLNAVKKELAAYNTIIAGYHVTDTRASRNFGVDTTIIGFIKELSKDKKVVFSFFGTPYFLSKLELPQTIFDAIIVSYDNSETAQNWTAQAIFGGIPFVGKLPVGADNLPVSYGIETNESTRLRYVKPEEIGIKSADLKKIDSLALLGIGQKAYPGCQVIAAYKGQVFYNKAIGTHTYDKNSSKVKPTDIYDVASVTKVSATLPLVMKLVDSKQVNINGKLKDYITLHSKSDNGNLVIRNILTHQAGLKAFIPFYLDMLTVSDGKEVFSAKNSTEFSIQIPSTKKYVNKSSMLDKNYFSGKLSDTYSLHVANALYSSTRARDYIYNTIDTTKLLSKIYRYSDFGFIYLQRVVESIYQNYENILTDAFFYNPLGMNYTTYLPLQKFTKSIIPPTEKDDVFRRQLVQGYVHDQTAAMLGGVAGHAGLFSNANDLAKLLQMYLNKGEYGGEHYIGSDVVSKFTQYNDEKKSRRGLGFDKPETNPKKASPVCKEASTDSYGHSGFTGCLVWVDPQRDLIYVFLSNRIHPSTENMRITKLSTRTEILANLLNIIDKLKIEEAQLKAIE
jgi:CubicO group peptidase (beta-lactamase class C family)